jgi:hypothetical protein
MQTEILIPQSRFPRKTNEAMMAVVLQLKKVNLKEAKPRRFPRLNMDGKI